MGKASRQKRERREQEGAGGKSSLTPGAANAASRAGDEKRLPIFWIVIALIVVGGLVALVVTAPDDNTKQAVKDAAAAPVYGDVEVDGEPLPKYSSGEDDAVGEEVPTITGMNFQEEELTLVEEGTPTVIVVVAHWCSHCAAEVPRLVEWAKDESKHEGINVIALSTAASKGQANFPPAEWLAREGWPFETMIDDEADTANDALGATGTPFMLFVKGDGTVLERSSGEMPDGEFDKAVQRLRDAE